MASSPASVFSALVTTGAAVAVMSAGVVTDSLAVPGARAWLWVVAITLVSTVLAVSTFVLGLARVGGPTASIVSTVEPVLTVSLAVALLGESFGAWHVLGGALVIGAVVALQSQRTAGPVVSVGGRDAPAAAAALPPARAPAGQPA